MAGARCGSRRVCALSPSAVDEDAEEDGHTVVATARGVFSSNGGVLSSIETGVSIIIPQGAIPDGVEQEIYFKVCRDNSILPPLDKEKGSRPRRPARRLPPAPAIGSGGGRGCPGPPGGARPSQCDCDGGFHRHGALLLPPAGLCWLPSARLSQSPSPATLEMG